MAPAVTTTTRPAASTPTTPTPATPPQPPQPPRRPRRRLLAGAAATVIAFGAGAGVAAWAAGVPGTSLTGALGSRPLSTAAIVQKIDPAVVDIVSTLSNGEAAGTGIVLTSSGEVLTNNHVIDGATSISVTDVGNGQTYQASVTGYDASHDIAVLKLTGASGLTTASIGDSSRSASAARSSPSATRAAAVAPRPSPRARSPA